MRFLNQNCPVCNEKFNEGDEIVVCPDCGTPHHRNCYNSLGECKNKTLHNENFSYKVQEESNKIDILIDDNFNKKEEKVNVVNVEFSGDDAKNNENLKSTIEELFKNINGKTTDQVLINQKPSSYYEAAIVENKNYYMPRFLIMEGTQKKFLLNVCAFIFPMAWAFYRKMYKLSFLVLAIYIALTGVTIAPIITNEELMTKAYQCVEEDPTFYEKFISYNSGQNVTFTKNQAELIDIIENVKVSPVITFGTLGVSIAMKIFMGLLGTKLYKDKLTKNIEKVMNLPLEDNQKKSYLKTKCGVTPMFIAVIVGFIEYVFFGNF